jgi:hypothetical protein
MIGGKSANEYNQSGPARDDRRGPGMIGGKPASEYHQSGPPRDDGRGAGMIGGKPASQYQSGPPPDDGRGPGVVGSRPNGANAWDPRRNRGGAEAVPQQVQVVQLSDILLRFFDFTVEEGHTYQYRVQVILKNPNHDLPINLLKDAAYRNERFLKTPWSEPTEPVRVTFGGGEVIAGPVRPVRHDIGFADSATAIFRQRNRTTGALLAYTFTRLEAGQVLNFNVKDTTKHVKFETPVGGIGQTDEFAFQSDNLLLDLRGGSHGEMLLLDASGRLTVQSEVGDNPSFAEESQRLEEAYNR